MSFDIRIDVPKDKVRWALMQFALRRSMRLVEPWYLDGVRIESMVPSADAGAGESAGAWSRWLRKMGEGLLNMPRDRAFVDIEINRRNARTVVSMRPNKRTGSLDLAQQIAAFLRDDRAFDDLTPATCSRCQAPVPIITARYCGRCGQALTASASARVTRKIAGESADADDAHVPGEAAKAATGREDRAVQVARAEESAVGEQPATQNRAPVTGVRPGREARMPARRQAGAQGAGEGEVETSAEAVAED